MVCCRIKAFTRENAPSAHNDLDCRDYTQMKTHKERDRVTPTTTHLPEFLPTGQSSATRENPSRTLVDAGSEKLQRKGKGRAFESATSEAQQTEHRNTILSTSGSAAGGRTWWSTGGLSQAALATGAWNASPCDSRAHTRPRLHPTVARGGAQLLAGRPPVRAGMDETAPAHPQQPVARARFVPWTVQIGTSLRDTGALWRHALETSLQDCAVNGSGRGSVVNPVTEKLSSAVGVRILCNVQGGVQ